MQQDDHIVFCWYSYKNISRFFGPVQVYTGIFRFLTVGDTAAAEEPPEAVLLDIAPGAPVPLLADGSQLENPAEYVQRVNKLLLELDSGAATS